eukprot:GHVS01015124.1.p1 GENE.GHVS01015124.1~~GHVS01015124.1.p1  ORF type:complete len:935 (-),score=75.40 GHVS01015124.1:300-3104(-)
MKTVKSRDRLLVSSSPQQRPVIPHSSSAGLLNQGSSTYPEEDEAVVVPKVLQSTRRCSVGSDGGESGSFYHRRDELMRHSSASSLGVRRAERGDGISCGEGDAGGGERSTSSGFRTGFTGRLGSCGRLDQGGGRARGKLGGRRWRAKKDESQGLVETMPAVDREVCDRRQAAEKEEGGKQIGPANRGGVKPRDGEIYVELDPERARSYKYPTRVVANAVCCSFLFGYNIAVMNSCNSIIGTYFQWCDNEYSADCRISNLYQTTVNASVFLGAMVGAVAAKNALSRGRRFGLIVSNFCFILGGCVGFMANGVAALLMSRVISGIGLGMVTVITPMYICEMSPAENRGFYVTMHQIFISVGILASIAMGLPLRQNVENSPAYRLNAFSLVWWRVLLGFNIVPASIALVGFFCICTEETPTVLMHEERLEEAVATIMQIYDANSFDEVEDQLIDLKRAVEEGRHLRHISICEAMGEPFYRYGLLVGMALAALQQLCGINVIVSASNDLFARSGMSSSMVTYASTSVALSNVLVTLLIAPFVESLGRRKLLLIGISMQCLSMLPIGIVRLADQFLWQNASNSLIVLLSLLSTVLFVSFFAIALGPVVWVYLSEIYPVEIRGTALAYCGLINWASSLLIVFSAKFLSTEVAFSIFAGTCFVGWLFCYRFIIETSGTSLENSPLSPRSLRSDSSLIRKSMVSSPSISVEDIRNRIRHAASSPAFPNVNSSSIFNDDEPSRIALDPPFCEIGLSLVEFDHIHPRYGNYVPPVNRPNFPNVPSSVRQKQEPATGYTHIPGPLIYSTSVGSSTSAPFRWESSSCSPAGGPMLTSGHRNAVVSSYRPHPLVLPETQLLQTASGLCATLNAPASPYPPPSASGVSPHSTVSLLTSRSASFPSSPLPCDQDDCQKQYSSVSSEDPSQKDDAKTVAVFGNHASNDTV